MCLIAWYWQPDSDMPLCLLANRDEFYARPTQALHWWNGGLVLAGKDLLGGGTWLGVSRTGRLAALTNFRSAFAPRLNTPSRGELVANFLTGHLSAENYLQQLAPSVAAYNPFNVLVFDGQKLMGLESRSARVLEMAPGIGAVSNADFHTPWPKLSTLQQALQSRMKCPATDGAFEAKQLLPLLHDRSIAPDTLLPDTGVPLPLERVLSATFVATPEYGTRACSVITVHHKRIDFTEQSFNASGLTGQVQETFQRASGNSILTSSTSRLS
jgi:uncharacterized protein with NRDE domain